MVLGTGLVTKPLGLAKDIIKVSALFTWDYILTNRLVLYSTLSLAEKPIKNPEGLYSLLDYTKRSTGGLLTAGRCLDRGLDSILGKNTKDNLLIDTLQGISKFGGNAWDNISDRPAETAFVFGLAYVTYPYVVKPICNTVIKLLEDNNNYNLLKPFSKSDKANLDSNK